MWSIDWEVIHYGDPSFDVAFLLNHLLMKSIAVPRHRDALAELARAFVEGFESRTVPEANWIAAAALEHLPALLLARVDGKSPAEYLDATKRQRARTLAMDLMDQPAESAQELFER